jgi:hypothetical protein
MPPMKLLLAIVIVIAGIATRLPAADLVGLPPEARAALERDKILVGTQEFRQCFTPYIDNTLPVFITSDALLNAFHVLFEESLARLEAANAAKLEALLTRMVKALPQAVRELKRVPEAKPQAVRRAEILVKTALRLVGRPAPGTTPEIERFIAAQVAEIERATGSRKPEWLGPPDDGFLALDFTRYAPRGFYDRSRKLQRYFRAAAWLQSVPLRVTKEEEFLAARLLGRAAMIGQPKMAWEYDQREPFLEAWNALLGDPDGPDLMTLMNDARDAESLDFSEFESRAEFMDLLKRKADELRKDRHPQVNDTVRNPPDGPPDPEYRILAARELPDATLLHRTSLAGGSGTQRYPDPLEVAAGLGSAFATQSLAGSLPAECWKNMQPALDLLAEEKPGGSLYHQYLCVLRELVNPPEPDAPDLLRGEAWQRKSCQTLLASWTQMRHSLVLQAKTNQFYAGMTHPAPGFVEPDPEFFRRLGELTLACLTTFSDAGAFDDNAESVIMDCLYRARDVAATLQQTGETRASDRNDLDRAWQRIGDAFPLPEEPDSPQRDDKISDADWDRALAKDDDRMKIHYGKLRTALDAIIRKLETAAPAARAEMLENLRLVESASMAKRWQGLAQLCSQAQSIAHRQLRKVPLTAEQSAWIESFGVLLATAMFYDGNSYEAPRDDAPRVVDVFSGPEGHLHAAIGRPRIFYVLYPWEGREQLCVGAVLPYFDFKHGPERLTDAAWLEQLKIAAPPAPAWVKPILQNPAAPDPAPSD